MTPTQKFCEVCKKAYWPNQSWQHQHMDNASWVTPVAAKNMDNSRTYRYRDPEKRRAQMKEVMRRRRARLRSGTPA